VNLFISKNNLSYQKKKNKS